MTIAELFTGFTKNPGARHPERSEGSPELSIGLRQKEILHCVQDDGVGFFVSPKCIKRTKKFLLLLNVLAV